MSKHGEALFNDEYYSTLKQEKIWEYKDLSILDLIKRIEELEIVTVVDGEYVDRVSKDYKESENLNLELLTRLELWRGSDTLYVFKMYLEEQQKKIDELERIFKSHRHKTVLGTYSEKASW